MKIPMRMFIIITLIINNSLNAQTTDFDYDYGDVSSEELTMKTYPKDSIAPVVQLLNYCKIYYDDHTFNTSGMFYKYHIRLKVLDQSKFKKKDIKLYSSYYSDIQTVEAQTINWVDGQKVITKIEQIYEKEIGENRKTYTMNFPKVSNGSVLEYQYTMFVPNRVLLKTFYVQNEYPIVKTEYRIAIPESKSYNVLLKGSEKPIDKGSQDFIDESVFYKSMEYFWVYQDVPAMKEENYTTTIENYITKIDVQLNEEVSRNYYELGVSNFISSNSFTDLGELYYNKYHLPLIGEMFQIRPVYKKVAPLLENATSTKDSILIIYDFVRSNMEWNGYFWLQLEEKPKDVFEKKKGTSADLNFVLMSLLYNFELKTHPILISTRNNGRVDMKHAFINQFNHVVIAAFTGEEWLFLDAIDNRLPYNLLPVQALNYEGLLIKNDTSYFINIPFEPSESVTFLKAKLDKNGKMTGTLNIAETNYIAAQSRGNIFKEGEEKYKTDFFKDIWVDAKATDIQCKNLKDRTKRLSQIVTFEAEDVGQVSGNLMYIDVFMGLGLEENPFQSEKRTYPVELPYPLKETMMLNIEIPAGYVVESIPEPFRFSLPNNDAILNFAVQAKNNVLTISSRMNINQVKFKVHQYDAIKQFFEHVLEKQTTQIVLKKE